MTSSLLLERIPKKIKLWENSKALTLYNNYTITANTVDRYYEKDVSHMSTIQLFGNTRSLSSSLPVYYGLNVVKIEFEIKQGSAGLTSGVGNEFWPHPTQHILVTNDHGGFVTEPIINFGFDKIRYRVYNNGDEDLKLSLVLRYT